MINEYLFDSSTIIGYILTHVHDSAEGRKGSIGAFWRLDVLIEIHPANLPVDLITTCHGEAASFNGDVVGFYIKGKEVLAGNVS